MKTIIILSALMAIFSMSMAQEVRVLNGDFDNDGQITQSDVSTLANICIAKSSMIRGVIAQGEIRLQTVSQYTTSTATFLMGDMNGDGRITVCDIATLIAQQGHPEKYLYAVIRDGKIVLGYVVGQLFIPIGEDEFVDDGEVEF